MSHGIPSPSQVNRSPDQTLTALVPTNVVNEQEMALDTALKALRNEIQSLRDGLSLKYEQTETIRRLENLCNHYKVALEVQADEIYKLQKNIQKAKLLMEIVKLNDEYNALEQESESLQKENDLLEKENDRLEKENGLLEKENDSLEEMSRDW